MNNSEKDQGGLESQNPIIDEVKKRMSDPDWKPDVAEFARREFRQGVEDLINRRYRNDKERALYERLIERPEMQGIWSTLFNWLRESGSIPLSNYYLVPGRLASFAAYYLGDSPLPAAITSPQRRKASEKISKYSRLLASELRNNNFPDSVFSYFPQEDLRCVVRNLVAYIGYEADIELLQILDSDPEGLSGSERAWINSIIDRASNELIDYGSVLKEDPSLGLYQVLKQLADDEVVAKSIQPVEVERAGKTEQSATHREFIRNFARWIAINFGRDAKRELTFMADFVDTVFDNDDIDEQVIKNGLRGYKYLP